MRDGKPSIIVGTSGLNDDLGRVDYVLADKTGTLTENRMTFRMCSIGGIQYGGDEMGYTTESVNSATLYALWSSEVLPNAAENCSRDAALLEYLGVPAITSPQEAFVHLFMLTCAICNTVIPEASTKSPLGVRFEGTSPDEEALVEMAASSGYILTSRTANYVTLKILRSIPGREESQWQDTTFKILGVNEYTCERKRMSVLVQALKTDDGGTGHILDSTGSMLLAKGADDVMLELCQRGAGDGTSLALCGIPVRGVRAETVSDINDFASAGNRTLMLAMRFLDEVETSEYLGALNEARHAITNRADRFVRVAEKFEKNLIVLGATAVEDKLQRGVSTTISRLLSAGVKVWMLTGDRYETSLNIARASELLPLDALLSDLRRECETKMTSEESDAFVREKQKAFERDYLQWVAHGKTKHLCVVLDGSAISCFSTSRENLGILANVISNAKTVLACRSSPSQKALITRLLKEANDRIILSIGDGANDVPMLQMAHIGIGVIGSEGMQAVRASDYAVATFSHLGELMLVHGRDCYNRITLVILYSFFKNICLVLPTVFFAFSNAFTGTSLYESWILMSYNVLWTSLPIIVLGALDITFPRWVVARYPIVYREGRQSISFNARKFLGWTLRAIFYAAIVYFSIAIGMSYSSALASNGGVMDHASMGTLVYYSVVVAVNVILVIFSNHLSSLFVLLCFASISTFLPCLFLYSRFGRPWSAAANVAGMLWEGSLINWLIPVFVVGVCISLSVLERFLAYSRAAATPVQKLQRWLAAAPRQWVKRGLPYLASKLKETFACKGEPLEFSLSEDLEDQTLEERGALRYKPRALGVQRLLEVMREYWKGAFGRPTSEGDCSHALKKVNPRTLRFNNLATESGYLRHSQDEAVKHAGCLSEPCSSTSFPGA